MNNSAQIPTIDPALEKLALLMDDRFEFLGFHFGLNFLIDLIPGIGDVVTTVIALFIFGMALKYKISVFTIARMLFNIGLYFIIGLIPWLGDIFGAWWKPNKRNLNLLRNNLLHS
jgi:hypothetical protein